MTAVQHAAAVVRQGLEAVQQPKRGRRQDEKI
jgi:hypothetical protein